jgi:hypothetical protein
MAQKAIYEKDMKFKVKFRYLGVWILKFPFQPVFEGLWFSSIFFMLLHAVKKSTLLFCQLKPKFISEDRPFLRHYWQSFFMRLRFRLGKESQVFARLGDCFHWLFMSAYRTSWHT